MAILAPVYATGNNGATGFYLMSMANVPQKTNGAKNCGGGANNDDDNNGGCDGYDDHDLAKGQQNLQSARLEYRHSNNSGTGRGVNPQHHYSIMVEKIPLDLR
eukprot:6714215-Ditylum_brightwellii.AAC.1